MVRTIVIVGFIAFITTNAAVLHELAQHATIAFLAIEGDDTGKTRHRNTLGRVAKQADASDLKSGGSNIPCGFEPRLGQ